MMPLRAGIYGCVVGFAVLVFIALWLRVLFPDVSEVSPLKEALVTVIVIASSIAGGVYVARTRMKKQDTK